MPDQVSLQFDVPTVSELTLKIKQVLELDFTDVLVEGELSNVKRSRNGHTYFTVKDNDAQLPCVLWKNTAERLELTLADGRQVVLGGSIQVYPPHGRYQMIVSLVEQAGTGKLQQAFERLKKKLLDEGLFDNSHKKPLPDFPERIGVITSSSGAAFQDIVSTLKRRWPLVTVSLCHASVQGLQAAPELVKGIRHFCDTGDVDLLIIGRGGGSLEDLWPFNEESVARTIFECPIPVISAVGHEVDFSISDFVADVRAATPTQAASLATPDINEIRFFTEDLRTRLSERLEGKITRYLETVQRLGTAHGLLVVKERLKNRKEQVQFMKETIQHRVEHRIPEKKERISRLASLAGQFMERLISRQNERLISLIHRLDKEDPDAPLEKGFARVWQGGKWVRRADRFQKNKNMELEWKDGKAGGQLLTATTSDSQKK
ncbi:MAG: exodeoxyribonuclease VII large subunit [Balneolaceae bacterium]